MGGLGLEWRLQTELSGPAELSQLSAKQNFSKEVKRKKAPKGFPFRTNRH